MSELIPLSIAADQVGKSVVALRRLVNAGKIPVKNEGVGAEQVYLVDLDQVKAYYMERDALVEGKASQEPTKPVKVEQAIPIRVAKPKVEPTVAEESPTEDWKSRAERAETKYQAEVVEHAKTRQQLVTNSVTQPVKREVQKAKPVGPAKVSTDSHAEGTNGIIVGVMSGIILLLLAVGGYLFLFH